MCNTHHFRAIVAVAIVALVSSAACRQGAAPDATDDTGQTQLEPVMTNIDDERIVTAIRSEYFASDQVKAENVDVSSDHGVVLLKGRVPSEEVRTQAIDIAKRVDGVERVDEELQVQAPGNTAASRNAPSGTRSGAERSTDGMVTTRILAQYYINPQLKPWNIDVTTSENGVVTLEGTIDNERDRAEAVRIARSTEGVTDVRDKLHSSDNTSAKSTAGANKDQGVMASDLSDAWITTKVQSRYFLDPDIKGRNINVDTSNGVVQIHGTVGSFSARRQAVAIARNTDGVREVHDELQVDATGDGASGARAASASFADRVDDAWVTTKIQSKFFMDGDLRATGIDVTTRDGVVTLDGAVASQAARDNAVHLARDTDGVRNVRDRIEVETGASSQ